MCHGDLRIGAEKLPPPHCPEFAKRILKLIRPHDHHDFDFPTPHTTTDKMLIPKSERKKIHEYLFREGVLVAKKDFESQHNDIDTKNLYVRRPPCAPLHTSGLKKRMWQVDTRLTQHAHTGRQGMPIPHLPWLPQDSVLLAMVLLHPHPRGS